MAVPQLLVLKEGQVVDNVLLHGKETFVLGRHQNCDIVAGHASISRHHLEIRVLHDSRELLLTDLRSVHGTKINGKSVQPLDPISMKEDDKFQLGASTRTYIVKWIPVTQEASESSCSSFTPSKFVESSILKGLEDDFQSALKLHNQENDHCSGTKPVKQQNSEKRVAFGNIQNQKADSPATKKNNLPVSSPSSGNKSHLVSPAAKAALRMSPAGKKIFGERSNLQIIQDATAADQTPSKLWLRRCSSNPLPTLVTNSIAPSAPKLPECVEASDDCLIKLSAYYEEQYPSDKENVAPPEVSKAGKESTVSSHSTRQPFQPLFFLPSPAAQKNYRPVFEPVPYPTPASKEDSFGSVSKYSRQFSGASGESIPRRKLWHIVVDTNCFLDDPAFKSLKQLEGIRETRLIIPKIVVRELDFMKMGRERGFHSRLALRWIEECMVKLPWWIHVQNSNEIRPAGTTPPLSPQTFTGKEYYPSGSALDLLSPTNDDHVLDCALLFERSVLDGRVVLLTNDTALKIKAMAEGLVSENASKFCTSLMSPYSDRFLWAGSRVSPRCKTTLAPGSHNNANNNVPRGLQVVL